MCVLESSPQMFTYKHVAAVKVSGGAADEGAALPVELGDLRRPLLSGFIASRGCSPLGAAAALFT